MAEQMTFPTPQESASGTDSGVTANDGFTTSDEPAKRTRKKKESKKAGKKAAKKGSKKATKKAAKKATKKATKTVAKKKTAKRKAAKRKTTSRALATRSRAGCEAVLRVAPTYEAAQLAAWSELSRFERRRALILMGAATAVTAGVVFFLVRRTAKAADSSGTSGDVAESNIEIVDAPIDVTVKTNTIQLPDPIKLGNIPPVMTRVYQLFDRFVEGGMEFFANLGDSEGGHNILASNPAGVPLSKASIERQMTDKNYGKKWSGSGSVPYTAYAEPEKAKALGAIGLFQGIAGTIGQAGRRNGRALLAPLPVEQWIEPANQLAAFMELFGALYHEFGAKTPVAMRIAWGYPSKANKTDDPYYIDRAAKFAKRQETTGVPSTSFGKMTLRDHTVEEVAAYFRQFDYTPILQVAAKQPKVSMALAPLKPLVMQRFSQMMNHPAFIGNDLT